MPYARTGCAMTARCTRTVCTDTTAWSGASSPVDALAASAACAPMLTSAAQTREIAYAVMRGRRAASGLFRMSVGEGLSRGKGVGDRAAQQRLQTDALFGERFAQCGDVHTFGERGVFCIGIGAEHE